MGPEVWGVVADALGAAWPHEGASACSVLFLGPDLLPVSPLFFSPSPVKGEGARERSGRPCYKMDGCVPFRFLRMGPLVLLKVLEWA